VRLFVRDATVPRFNPPAEPARTVGFEKRDSARTVGFGKRGSENGSRDSEKRAARQGREGQGAGPGGQGRGQIKSKR
jgi:hypothetical protein